MPSNTNHLDGSFRNAESAAVAAVGSMVALTGYKKVKAIIEKKVAERKAREEDNEALAAE